MNFRHWFNSLLGSEESFRRRLFARLMWRLSAMRDLCDPDKRALLRSVREHTLLSYRRLSNLHELCLKAVPGAFVECGVWKGGAAAVMARVAGDGRKTWLFDSFEGLPEPSAEDGDEARSYAEGRAGGRLDPLGRCVASFEEVERWFFDTLKFSRSSVMLRKGWFQETLPRARAEIGPIAVLRLDGDWYESTRVCMEALYDNVAPGGVVIVDDYYFWKGCGRAVDDFLARRGLTPDLRRIDASGAWFRKG